jgi:hypothetical protein
LINLLGVYHYDAHSATAERADLFGSAKWRDDHLIESSGGVYIENRVQWADKFRTMTGLREDLY